MEETSKADYEEQDDIEREMELYALAEPEPPDWGFDPDHPTADAEPPEAYFETEPPEWLEQGYKEEQELDAKLAYGIPQDGALAKTEVKE